MSLLLGRGAYAWDKNTSARLCAKNTGGLFAGHYGNKSELPAVLEFGLSHSQNLTDVFYWPILPFLHALDLCQSWKASLLLSMIWVFTFIYNR